MLSSALQIAQRRTDIVIKAADVGGKKAQIWDEIYLTSTYFKALDHLIKNGDLPQEFIDRRKQLKAEEEQKESNEQQST